MYVNSQEQNNDPHAQARAFQKGFGAMPNSAKGFATKNLVQAPSFCGLVIGTCVEQAWVWHWVTMSSEGRVDAVKQIKEDEFKPFGRIVS